MQVSLRDMECVGEAAAHFWVCSLLRAAWAGGKLWVGRSNPRHSVPPGAAVAFFEERARQLGLGCQKVEVSLGP